MADMPGSNIDAAACAEVTTSPTAGIPNEANLASSSPIGGAELLVAKITLAPEPRSRITASGAPGIGRPASQTTPSRSRTQLATGGSSGCMAPHATAVRLLDPQPVAFPPVPENGKSRRHEADGLNPNAESSDDANVLGLFTLAAGGHVELDPLTLVEGLVSITLNVGVVNEHIVATLPGDEAETLFTVEKLDRALCHNNSFHLRRTPVARPSGQG